MHDFDERNKELLKKYKEEGSKEAFDELVISNTKLVRFIIKKLNVPTYLQDDLYDLGVIYLIETIKNFDMKYIDNCKFSSFACLCIERRFHRFFSYEKTHNVEVSVFLDGSEDEGMFDMYDSVSFSNYINDNYFDDIEDKIDLSSNMKKLEYALENFSDFDRKILYMCFGLNGESFSNQSEIAQKYGYTRAEISRRIIRLKKKLLKYVDYDKKKNMVVLKEPLSAKTIVRMSFDDKKLRDDLNKIICKFKHQNKDVFLDYFGMEGREKLSIEKICEKYNFEEIQVKRFIRYYSEIIEKRFNNTKKDCKKNKQ